jgi:hypothetical protein
MGRVRKSLNEKVKDGTKKNRLVTGKKFTITEEPPVALNTAERHIYDQVVDHLNLAGAGMNIDLRLICAYCKDVIVLDAMQDQLSKTLAHGGEESTNDMRKISTIINGCHQRITQNQQSLAIGSLNRRKLSHFQDHIDSIIEERAAEDPFAALLK